MIIFNVIAPHPQNKGWGREIAYSTVPLISNVHNLIRCEEIIYIFLLFTKEQQKCKLCIIKHSLN